MLGEIAQIIRIAGWQGSARLLRNSRQLRTHARGFALMHALLALETCDLNGLLLSEAGLDIADRQDLDTTTLETICEYMYELNILARPSKTVYKAKNRKQFDALLAAMYACGAYQAPAENLHKLLRRQSVYGRELARDDRYDAIASAELTSTFSYGLSHRVLQRAGAHDLIDVGCGTGEYLFFLAKHGFPGKLYGMDHSVAAIEEGRARGFERDEVALVVGDIFDLASVDQRLDRRSIDVVSFMFVLHEFDKAQIKSILENVRQAFPRARIMLTDLMGKSSDEVRRQRHTPIPELKFVHGLSLQTIRTPAEWKGLFAGEGFIVAEEATNALANQMCFLFAPA